MICNASSGSLNVERAARLVNTDRCNATNLVQHRPMRNNSENGYGSLLAVDRGGDGVEQQPVCGLRVGP